MKQLIAAAKKAQKKFWGSNRVWTNDLHDTSAMLYQLSYEASPEAGQVLHIYKDTAIEVQLD